MAPAAFGGVQHFVKVGVLGDIDAVQNGRAFEAQMPIDDAAAVLDDAAFISDVVQFVEMLFKPRLHNRKVDFIFFQHRLRCLQFVRSGL